MKTLEIIPWLAHTTSATSSRGRMSMARTRGSSSSSLRGQQVRTRSSGRGSTNTCRSVLAGVSLDFAQRYTSAYDRSFVFTCRGGDRADTVNLRADREVSTSELDCNNDDLGVEDYVAARLLGTLADEDDYSDHDGSDDDGMGTTCVKLVIYHRFPVSPTVRKFQLGLMAILLISKLSVYVLPVLKAHFDGAWSRWEKYHDRSVTSYFNFSEILLLGS